MNSLAWKDIEILKDTKIRRGGASHKILQTIAGSPDGICPNRDITDLGYAWQMFTYLQTAGYVDRVARGMYSLSGRGKDALESLNTLLGDRLSWKNIEREHPQVQIVHPGSNIASATLAYMNTRYRNTPGACPYTFADTTSYVQGVEVGTTGDLLEEYTEPATASGTVYTYGVIQLHHNNAIMLYVGSPNAGYELISPEEQKTSSLRLANTEIEYPTPEEIIECHDDILAEYGGREGTFPETISKLEAAIGRMQSGAFDQEFYPSLVEKAAVLMHSIITTHPFPDVNKRTAFMAGVEFLHHNGLTIPDSDSIADTILLVADDKAGYEHLLEQVRTNTKDLGEHHDEALQRLSSQDGLMQATKGLQIGTKEYFDSAYQYLSEQSQQRLSWKDMQVAVSGTEMLDLIDSDQVWEKEDTNENMYARYLIVAPDATVTQWNPQYVEMTPAWWTDDYNKRDVRGFKTAGLDVTRDTDGKPTVISFAEHMFMLLGKASEIVPECQPQKTAWKHIEEPPAMTLPSGYVVARTANHIDEFKQAIAPGQIWLRDNGSFLHTFEGAAVLPYPLNREAPDGSPIDHALANCNWYGAVDVPQNYRAVGIQNSSFPLYLIIPK